MHCWPESQRSSAPVATDRYPLSRSVTRPGARRHRLPDAELCGGDVSFDDLISEHDQVMRNSEAKRFGCLKIHDQIELGWLLYRHVARLRAAQNLVDIVGSAPKLARL